MSRFSEAYKIGTPIASNGSSSHSLTITKDYVNWYDAAFGGCLLALAFESCQCAAGNDLQATHVTIDFLRNVPIDSTVHAKAKVTKRGKSFTNVSSVLLCNEQPALKMGAVFFSSSEFLGKPSCPPIENNGRTSCDIIINSRESPLTSEFEEPLQSMLTSRRYRDILDRDALKGKASVGLYTNESFMGSNGMVDPSVLGILVDDSTGISSWSLMTPCVTTSMSFDILRPIPIGTFLVCDSRVTCANKYLMSVQGTLWSDDEMVGTCSSIFFHKPDTQ